MDSAERIRHPRPPLFDLLRADGRSMAWLARRTGYSHQHVKNVAAGFYPASDRFRAACAVAMGLDEAVLFHGGHGAYGTGRGASIRHPA